MSLKIHTFTVGPLENNTYLIFDKESKEAAIIDPAIGSNFLIERIKKDGFSLKYILLTHAHFDHIANANQIADSFSPKPSIGLHSLDISLWQKGGGSQEFGFDFSPGTPPDLDLAQIKSITLGNQKIIIMHTPGHTPGHVVFYIPEENAVICGDLIFFHGIGRADFSGGDHQLLINSIRNKLFSLPPNTSLFCGHGPPTTIKEEQIHNPFLN